MRGKQNKYFKFDLREDRERNGNNILYIGEIARDRRIKIITFKKRPLQEMDKWPDAERNRER